MLANRIWCSCFQCLWNSMLTHCGTMQAGRVSGAAELCLSLAALGNFSSLSLDFLLFKMGVLGGLHDRRYTESLSTRQGAEPLLVGCDLISHASSWACGKGLENFLVVNVKKKKNAVPGRLNTWLGSPWVEFGSWMQYGRWETSKMVLKLRRTQKSSRIFFSPVKIPRARSSNF